MVQLDPERELKLVFINRQKRLYENILRQLEESNNKGAVSDEMIEEYKSHYNDIVYEDAKQAYIQHKIEHSYKSDYVKDLFSAEI